jgi:hypothetical protein
VQDAVALRGTPAAVLDLSEVAGLPAQISAAARTSISKDTQARTNTTVSSAIFIAAVFAGAAIVMTLAKRRTERRSDDPRQLGSPDQYAATL